MVIFEKHFSKGSSQILIFCLFVFNYCYYSEWEPAWGTFMILFHLMRQEHSCFCHCATYLRLAGPGTSRCLHTLLCQSTRMTDTWDHMWPFTVWIQVSGLLQHEICTHWTILPALRFYFKKSQSIPRFLWFIFELFLHDLTQIKKYI